MSTNLHWCRWFPNTFVKFGDNWYVDVEADGELEDNNKTEQLVDGQLDTTKLANQDNSKQQDYTKDTVESMKSKEKYRGQLQELPAGGWTHSTNIRITSRTPWFVLANQQRGRGQNETKTKLKDNNGRQSG